ncbi:hypothetical protein LK994_09250 [Ferruginibacter lapsinanis]|uniref:hypothetical protein n=1 Tax=Ferruginibacter lapsinanis TaxID=563172 RepID=UPI001E4012CA|nr:hypothetical protein [Ferruginibacter lapsinanis]UEG48821.1 hypothetical protein LK994_09250 [Ferruginibacter lapsinanis]
MKKIIITCFAFFVCNSLLFAQVGIGTATPDVNAVLDLTSISNNKGLLLPRLTNTSMVALSSATNGMIIFNTTDNFLYIRKSNAWQKITDNSNGFSLPYVGSTSTAGNAFYLTNNTGNGLAAQSLGSGYGVYGYSNSGYGIYGETNIGTAGYFNAIGNGYALVTGSGNVGLGISNPAFQLDVAGRARIRNDGNTAGIWYNKTTNAVGAFLGMYDDSTFGVFGAGYWQDYFDIKNGRMGIGVPLPLESFQVNGNIKLGNNQTWGIEGDRLIKFGDADYVHIGEAGADDMMELKASRYYFTNGKIGIQTNNAQYPLTFADAVGDKISLWGGNTSATTNHYGLGIQGSLMQLFTNGASADIAFGYGRSGAFTEKYRMGNNGVLNINNGRIHFNGEYDVANHYPSGIEFTNAAGSSTRSFFGMLDDNNWGVYGYGGAGWGFNYNVNSGNVGIGDNNPQSKLHVEGGTGTALEISGGIKTTGSTKAAFRLTADNSNLWDVINNITPSFNDPNGVRINSPLCNNNPNALIFITQVATNSPADINLSSYGGNLYAYYLSASGYWYITQYPMVIKQWNGNPNFPIGKSTLFKVGDTFNVLIINQ